jgi:thymidylate synthase (FAD)
MAISKDENAEIEAARTSSSDTKRATVAAIEEILFVATPVLDHGFVRVIDYMGDDSSVVQAARVSYGRGTKQVSEDRALIRYLMRHGHTTPFEMCELKLHVKLPIFVARQWIRHRTANVNEYSARYSVLDKEFYVPAGSQLAAQATSNRQGRGDVLQGEDANRVLKILISDSERAYSDYLELLNDPSSDNYQESRSGLARELARMNLPLNFYTQWYWKIDLHNLLHFLRLRSDSHAQFEIRAYANVILDILKRWVPHTYDAFSEYDLNSVRLSAAATNVIRRALAGERVTYETSRLSRREWNDLIETFPLE